MDRQTGFTLIELVFVLGVLAILATLGVQTLGGNERITQLASAEDQVIAELRRVRSETLYGLPKKSGSNLESAAINARTNPSVSVCPERINYRYGGNYAGSVHAVECRGCTPCDQQSPYQITLSAGGRNTAICLTGETGRVERSPCD
ncbi:pilus assembly FimT family protein [Spiribacter roseus]|uniref:Type II secretion system protein n=1 Tax=Spiribacter roseus TaxID=1855875 RepID=A0ABV3RX66_9GAMM